MKPTGTPSSLTSDPLIVMGRDKPAGSTSFSGHPTRSVDENRVGHRGSSRWRSATSRTLYNVASFGQNRTHGRTRRVAPYPQASEYRRPRTRSVARVEGQQLLEQQQSQAHNLSLSLDGEGSEGSPPAAPWTPSIAVGSPLWNEGEDLSRIDVADRKIAQRRAWVEFYENSSHFSRMLQEAIKEREQLDDGDEENTRPRSSLASTHARAIQRRLGMLRSVAGESEFPPERANLDAAIAGYESGAIPYSSSYTLIWAGRIVDRCPDHASFTRDRKERLDRYFARYGEGWFWYEPPLIEDGRDIARAPSMGRIKKGVCLENKNEWRRKTDNMGHYRLTMGFRRRREAVAREHHRRPSLFLPGLPQQLGRIQSAQSGAPARRPVEADPDGPRIFFDMLLDSGATLPCLYSDDLATLGIDPRVYAAQGVRTIATAESVSAMKIYELDACVYPPGDASDQQSSWPAEGHGDILGGTVPVVILGGQATSDGQPEVAPDRLSGLLPFHVCYWSSAPGNFKIWLGKDRRDVLGAGRLPGQMRLASWKKHTPLLEKTLLETMAGTPRRAVFEHQLPNGSVVRDEDEGPGSVIVAGPRGVNLDDPDAKAEGIRVLQVLRAPTTALDATWARPHSPRSPRAEKKSAARSRLTPQSGG